MVTWVWRLRLLMMANAASINLKAQQLLLFVLPTGYSYSYATFRIRYLSFATSGTDPLTPTTIDAIVATTSLT